MSNVGEDIGCGVTIGGAARSGWLVWMCGWLTRVDLGRAGRDRRDGSGEAADLGRGARGCGDPPIWAGLS